MLVIDDSLDTVDNPLPVASSMTESKVGRDLRETVMELWLDFPV